MILLRNAGNDARDGLRWSVVRGGPAAGDLKDPAVPGATVAICVYDASAGVQPLLAGVVPSGGTCGRHACWKSVAGGGYVYRNDVGTLDGITGIRLRVGGSGALQLAVDGRGANLPLPVFPFTVPVTVQLVVADDTGTTCWQSRFVAAQRNDAGSFRAVAP
jgi:hypothetical protein